MSNLIEATILIGSFKGESVVIPRIPIIHKHLNSPLNLKEFSLPYD